MEVGDCRSDFPYKRKPLLPSGSGEVGRRIAESALSTLVAQWSSTIDFIPAPTNIYDSMEERTTFAGLSTNLSDAAKINNFGDYWENEQCESRELFRRKREHTKRLYRQGRASCERDNVQHCSIKE